VIVKKGRASQGAITPVRTAFIKVLEAVDGPAWTEVNVEEIDIDEHIQRFANLTKGTYTPKSISVYKSHIARATGWYLKFMSPSDAGWMPIISPRAQKKSETSHLSKTSQTEERGTRQSNGSPVPVMHNQIAGSTNLITYPFPLRDGQIANLSLPSPIHRSDAERIARFIETLVIDNTVNDGVRPSDEERDA
jgi:hypothetical protein